MSITLRGNRAAVSDTFEHYAPLVKQIAQRFAQKFSRDVDECEADANLAFLEAYHGFDRDRNPNFAARIQHVVHTRLLDKVRIETRHRSKYKLKQVDIDLNKEEAAAVVGDFDRDGLERIVGDDAKIVLRLMFDVPSNLVGVFGYKPPPSNLRSNKNLRRILMDRFGWAAKRIKQSFWEIREALA